MYDFKDMTADFVKRNKEMLRQASRHGSISPETNVIGTILIEGIELIVQAMGEYSGR